MTSGPADPQAGQPGQQQRGPVRAPELEGGQWIQGGPLPIRDRGQPLLIDFWDYTCVNCVRTLPYLAEWHRRYAEHGLTIIGVHTPEFTFGRNPDHVRAAIKGFDIPYPVVLDADYQIWQAYSNQYWPAKYFVDGQGMIRAQHYGEGAYAESEQTLQMMLREQPDFTAELPAVMTPLRPEDTPGAVCYRVTPELYCGYRRGTVGNIGTMVPDQPHGYTDPGKHMEGVIYLDGDWILGAESLARPFGARGTSRAQFSYLAAELNLVAHPPVSGGAGVLRVLLDGQPLAGAAAGEDVADGVVTIDRPRMYRLVAGADVERHELTLETDSDGLTSFAFTFLSCVAPPPGEAAATGGAGE